jgi:CRP-like cAMP-binding protein
MVKLTVNPTIENRLLGVLPAIELDALLAEASCVSHPLGYEVYREGQLMRHVCFPRSAVYSVVIDTERGDRVEAMTVGNEGFVGLSAVMGLRRSPFTIILQVPGDALQISVDSFVRLTSQNSGLKRLLQLYATYVFRCISQGVACNALHSVEQRACRWLLMAQERAGGPEFMLTQEFLAVMLAVSRPTVSSIAQHLQQAGLIDYRRGVIRVLDAARLEANSCECYRIVKLFYEEVVALR